jgi:hypothetical protein
MDKALSGEAVGPMKELTHRQRSRGLTSMDSAGATKGSAKYCVSRATLSPLNSMMRRRAKFHRHAVTVSTSRKIRSQSVTSARGVAKYSFSEHLRRSTVKHTRLKDGSPFSLYAYFVHFTRTDHRHAASRSQ